MTAKVQNETVPTESKTRRFTLKPKHKKALKITAITLTGGVALLLVGSKLGNKEQTSTVVELGQDETVPTEA